ncbi:MAG: helix-turn-helix transcriptional regulator [Bacteroidota bacterium]|jgi:AraC-like DNA-binding protein|nr:MAG: AraC family transcriptional regulator [Bacteroidota bacterium]
MKVHDIKPAPLLDPFISGYKIIETDAERINRILPSTSIAMAVRLRGKNILIDNGRTRALPQIVISGLQKSPRHIGYGDDTRTLIVQFKPGGASAFFREPLHKLFGETTSLDDLIAPAEVSTINDRISSAESDPQRISIVEEFLTSLCHKGETDKLISTAILQINHAGGFIRIKDLRDQLHISKDAFEKRFRKIVGTSPKQYASLVRMSTIVGHGRGRDQLLDAAFNAGFFDESHFIKAFKQFTGQSPTDFSKSGPAW